MKLIRSILSVLLIFAASFIFVSLSPPVNAAAAVSENVKPKSAAIVYSFNFISEKAEILPGLAESAEHYLTTDLTGTFNFKPKISQKSFNQINIVHRE